MVGRKTFRNLGERVRNAMNIRRGGGYRNLARSGQNPQHARAISASRSTTAWAVAIVVAMIAAVTVMFVPVPAAQADVTTVTDPDTTNNWSSIAVSSTSTQNIGRIWTDKSVFDDDYTFSGSIGGQTVSKGDSDFLVGLSALSSTSNLKTMVKTSVPLDIVLVLDTSGSMSGQKLTSLKNAANNFIDATADANEGLDQSDQSRISIVTFASGSNVRQQLNYVTDQNAQQYKNTIRGLSASGATWAEAGLETAQNQLNSHPRQDAQKVVIFFTDGQPNHGNGFDNEVAAEAVNTAHAMKQSGVTIYAVGVMNGADASVTDDDDFNEYMNGVSSNYPDATAEGDNGGWFGIGAYYNTTFGTRAEGDYYKASSNASDIENIFEELSDEIQQGVGSGSPIEEVTHEGALNPGTLTFTDELGSYMEVSGGTMTVVYGDRKFTSTNKTTADNVDTYHFEGTVAGNAVYKEADLADLTVTVTHGDTLATGDIVTVTIPADLIPMRNYDVDTETNAMTVSQAYPVRLFYGVSLKADAKDALSDPTSDEYAAIMASQKSEDGKTIDFYSNNFTKGAADGLTTATFEPNAGNKFYYYTQDATLYSDAGCTQEATRWDYNNNDVLYWKDTYWVQTSEGVGEERSAGVAVRRGTDEWKAIQQKDGWDGAYYIPAGTKRTDRPATLTDGKDRNSTGTANNVLNPSWSGDSEVSQALGNNGKLYFEMPGSLEIKKTVNWGNASDDTKQNKNEFTFEISASTPSDEEGKTEPLSGTYNYYVGDAEQASGQVTFTDGTAELKIQGGTTVRIEGMPAGTTFTVTEQGVGQNGWTVTDGTAQQGVNNDIKTDGVVTGTIESGSQVSLTFDNAYKASDVNLSTNTKLSVKKVLEGRDWRDSDEFTFEIDGLGNTAGSGIATPEPAETTVTVDDQTADYTKAFGDITFTAPGEYRYSITEDNDTDPINGIDYSAAIYRAVVTVTDDGNGKLVVSKVELQQTQNDAGTMGADADPVPVQGSTATFTNTYDVNAATTNIDGTKNYTDTTGGNGINYGKFKFQLEALGGYETEGGSSADYTVNAKDVPMPADVAEGTTTKQVTNTGYGFTFGTISYDGNDAGKTFEYKVTEIAGDEQGMDYDKTEHIVKVKVEEVTTGEGTPEEETHLVATPDMTPTQVSFTNKYDPTDARLAGGTAIHGTKTFTGRDMKDDEKFYFQLTATNDNAKSVLPEAEVVEVTKDDMKNGSAGFNFDDMSFSKTGEYTFTVNEVAPDGQGGYTETTNGSGMTYDTNICTVTVNVTDNKQGALVAGVTYSNDVNSSVTDKAQFNNSYKASMNYGAEGKGGIKVTKQLTNRPMDNDEFAFSITGVANDSGKTTADDANAKLTEADKIFKNTAAASDQTITMDKLQNVKFDQTDAGKTYSYVVDETTENDADALPGVTCDQSQYRVDIAVADNGDGTMHTVTTVTQTKNADGTDIDGGKVIINQANSDDTGYTVPTFGFVNEYNPTPATVGEDADHQIQVTKKVEGADSATDYTFTLTAQETDDGHIGNITGLDENNQLTVTTDGTIKAGESQTKTFGKLTFTKPGTYTFTVQENQPDADEGWTFDDANGDSVTDTHTVTVQVTDRNDEGKYDGKLYIADVIGSPVEITNSYKAEAVIGGGDGADQQITVQKSVTGADTAADASFQFKIEPVDPKDNKWKNVKAVDDTFDALTSITDGVKQGEPKTASFAGIQFNATGEYQFKVTEVGAADFNAGDNRNGWTYDEHEAFVTVTVTDDDFDGQLEAAVSYDNSKATTDADKAEKNTAAFTNKYEAGSTTLTGSDSFTGTKTIEGRNGIDGETFGFTLAKGEVADGGDWSKVTFKSGDDEASAFTNATTTATMNGKDASANFSFDGTFTFAKAGTYTFNVTEISHNGEALPEDGTKGMTYDRHTGTITVTVTDDGKGNLHATAKAGEGNASTTFVNKYAAAPATATGETALKLTKEDKGAPALSDFDFNVKLTKGEANNVKLGSGDSLTDFPADGMTVSTKDLFDEDAQQGKQGSETVGFGDITFTAAGDYVFTVTEKTETTAAGWTYASGDENAKTITVHVTDDGFDGQLDIKTEGGIEGNNPTFTNKYESGSITTGTDNGINVQKTLTGRDWLEGDSFEFVLEAVDDAPMPEGDGNKVTITNASNPKTAVFSGITYNAAGEYKYTVKETEGKLGGVTYDEHTVNVTVTIVDEDYDGSFEVKSVVYDNSDATTDADKAVDNAAAFTNVYKASGSLDGAGNLAVTKNYTSNLGDPWTPDDSFGFTLAADTTDPETQTAVNNGWITLPDNAGSADEAGITIKSDTKDHKASFGNIEFTKAGTYKFLVSEVLPEGVDADNPTKDGITYDTSVKTVTVNVTDNGKGTLTATVAEGSDALTFNNTYNVQPVMFRAAYFALQGNKVLDGRNWEQGDTFTFTMTAGRGTNPDGTQMADGVVEATMPDKTSDTIVPLEDGSKVTDNSAQFTFTDERYPGGDVVPDADDVFTFTQPGTYRYLIAETNPNASNPGSGILGVTYDQTQYRLTVEVKDDGNGNLVVESSKFSSRPTAGAGEWTDIAGDQGITFTNKYSANEVGVSFNAAKVLNGRDTAMTDNEFKFHMAFAGWMSNDDFDAQSEDWKMDGEVADKAPKPAADKGNIIRGDVIFDNVTFTSGNVGYTYRYAITEVIPDDATNAAFPGVSYGKANAEQKAAAGWTKNGVTYDGSTKYVTAKVTSEQAKDPQNPNTYIEVVRVATGGEAPYNEQTGKFEGGAIFTNTYDAGSTDVDTGTADAQLTKVLTGKAWDGDSFTFKIEAVSNTAGIEVADQPMPANTEVTVAEATGEDKDGNDQATFSFGKISYDTPGSYVYKVTEVAGDNAGIDYSTNEATITVSVEDNNNGGYTTGVTVANNTFTNTYHSELDYNAAGGLEITKTFKDADMREFSFTVTPKDKASADKLGIDQAGETFTTKPGATVGDDSASHAEIMVIDAATEAKFTQDDADDTYTYTVQETKGADAGVTYDGTVYTVTITTADDGQGGIKVTTTVTDGAGYNQTYVYDNDDATDDPTAVIPFTNTYTATGELGGNGSTSIKATKTLTNRPMTDGEFTFNVTNAADPAGTVVATGTNAADGTITFGAIDYSIDQMMKDVDNGLATPSVVDGKNTFTYQYMVAEDQAGFDEGVTAIAGSFDITVTVTDNGDGTLGIAVTYPDGADGLTFRNAYGEGDQGQATLNIAGEKKLDIKSGNNAPNIEGKYTFELTGEDGAPMPATTTAVNDAAGNVTFGDITYTMENVFGDTGSASADEGVATQSAQRTKTFTYTVTESGAVAGVANDAEASKTFTVTVTDNGDGTLSAASDPAQGAKFSFTNTYGVEPTDSSLTGKGGITVTKKLTGRDMAEGEFTVVMTDRSGAEVARGTNDGKGGIKLSAITFTERGDYDYNLYEAVGDKSGVTYDRTQYTATAHVEDQGNGTLKGTWTVKNAKGVVVDAVSFHNTYAADPTSVSLGASKVLDGRELKDGEFTFQLTGADESTPMPEDPKDGVSTATNAANGSIGFGTIVYDQAGTYQYTVSEVNDKQDGVTYDDTTYEVTVTVTDNTAEGRLEATVDYGDATALVFTNTYKKAEATIPKTGAAVILPSVIGFILLLGAGGMYASKRRKRS